MTEEVEKDKAQEDDCYTIKLEIIIRCNNDRPDTTHVINPIMKFADKRIATYKGAYESVDEQITIRKGILDIDELDEDDN